MVDRGIESNNSDNILENRLEAAKMLPLQKQEKTYWDGLSTVFEISKG